MEYFLTTLSPDFYNNDLSKLLSFMYTAVYIIYKSVNFPMSTLPSLGDISDFNERNGTFNILHLVHDFQTFIVQSQNNVLPGH